MRKAALQTWFSGRWAAGMGSASWQALPMRSTGRLLAPAFILACGFGFAVDLLLLNYQPLARGFFWPVYSGTLTSVTLAARMKRLRRLVPVLILLTLAGLWLGIRISFHSPAPPDVEGLKRRVVFDAIGILVGTIFGYRLLVDFIRTEGVATVRMQTELALAHGIQATLTRAVAQEQRRAATSAALGVDHGRSRTARRAAKTTGHCCSYASSRKDHRWLANKNHTARFDYGLM